MTLSLKGSEMKEFMSARRRTISSSLTSDVKRTESMSYSCTASKSLMA